MGQRLLLGHKEIEIILNRLACQLIEKHGDFSDTVLVGIQPRGTFLANRLQKLFSEKYGRPQIQTGCLDITFFRDDFRRTEKPLEASETKLDFQLDGKHVVFIDDVLYTGRSIRAALTAIQNFGRPESVELLVLIDRRFSRHLPIQPDYRGRQVDAISGERVIVSWSEDNGHDSVQLIKSTEE